MSRKRQKLHRHNQRCTMYMRVSPFSLFVSAVVQLSVAVAFPGQISLCSVLCYCCSKNKKIFDSCH